MDTLEERKAALLRSRGIDPAQYDIDMNTRAVIPRPGAVTQDPMTQMFGGPLKPKEPGMLESAWNRVTTPPANMGPIETFARSAVGAIPETAGALALAPIGVAGGTALGGLTGPAAPVAAPAGALAGGVGAAIGGSYLGSKTEEALAPDFWKRATDTSTAEPGLATTIARELGSAAPQLLGANWAKSLAGLKNVLQATPTLTRFTPAQKAVLANAAVGTGVGAGSAVMEDVQSQEGVGVGTVPKALIRGAAGLLGNEPNRLGTAMSLGQWKPTPAITDEWAGAAGRARDAIVRPRTATEATPEDLAAMAARDVTPQWEPFQIEAPAQRPALPEGTYEPNFTRGSGITRPPAVDPAFAKEDVRAGRSGYVPDFSMPERQPKLPAPGETAREQGQTDALQLGVHTDEWDKVIKDVASRKYKADVESGIDDLRGKGNIPVAGSVKPVGDLERYLIQLSKAAGADTGPHEMLHTTIMDVLARGTPGEKRFAERVLAAAGGEEKFVQEGAQEFMRRLAGEAAPGGGRGTLLKDLTSFIRAKLGNATSEDLKALGANTLRRGAGASQYRPEAPGPAPRVASGATSSKEGEKSPKKPNETQRTQPLNIRGPGDENAPGASGTASEVQPVDADVEVRPDGDTGVRVAGDTSRPAPIVEPVGMAAEKPAPERAETIAAQFAETLNAKSSKRVTLLPPGSPDVAVPKGLAVVDVPQGRAVYNPQKISLAAVRKGGEGVQYDGRLLGMSQESKPKVGENVVTASKGGVGDIVTEAVAPGGEAAAAKAVSEAVPGGKVEVRPAAEIVGERYQPLGPREYFEENPVAGPELKRSRDFLMGPVRRLEKMGSEAHRTVGDAFRRLFSKRDMVRGRFGGILSDIGRADKAVAREAYEAFVRRVDTQEEPVLSSREAQDLYEKMSDWYRETGQAQIDAGQLINGRERGLDPFGAFTLPSRDTMRILTEQQGTDKFKALRGEFVEYNRQRGFSEAEANDAFEAYVTGLPRSESASSAVDFGAVSSPEGTKLPPSWIEPDAASAFERYLNRYANSRAWYDVVESDEGVSKYLRGGESLERDPDVVRAFNSFREVGENSKAVRTFKSASSVINTGILGPLTRARDLATTPFKALAYAPVADIPSVYAELFSPGKHMAAAKSTGLLSPSGHTLVKEVLNANDAVVGTLDKIARTGATVQGLEALETAARTTAQALGTGIGKAYKARAAAGDEFAKDFLSNLGSDAANISDEELGTRVARLFQGQYNALGAPEFMSRGALSPFFTLSRWSTEQYNNFRQFAVEPAIKGNPAPLMKFIVAHLLGGAAVSQIGELFTDKKPYIAEIEEIKNAPDPDRQTQEAAYKIGNMLQAVSLAGIPFDIAMLGAKAMTGRPGAEMTAPAIDIAQDALIRTYKMTQAILSGVPAEDVLLQYGKDLAKRNVQLYQILTRGTEEREQQNRTRDLRMYERLAGKPITPPMSTIDYSRADERAFDEEQDLGAAFQRAQGLKQRAAEKYPPGTREFADELRKFRASRLTTMPVDPRARMDYLRFLAETQGEEKAREALQEYQRAREIQLRKRAMF